MLDFGERIVFVTIIAVPRFPALAFLFAAFPASLLAGFLAGFFFLAFIPLDCKKRIQSLKAFSSI